MDTAQTVINPEHRHTSVIRTLRERWSLGAPLTARDAIAPDLAPVFSLDAPRPPEDWPDVNPPALQPYDTSLVPLDKPLTAMQKGGIFALLSLGQALGHAMPAIALDTPLTGAEGMALMGELFNNVFPNLTPM